MIHKVQPPKTLFSKRNWTLVEMEIESSLTGKKKFSMYAERPDTAMIVPFVSDSEVILIREYCPTQDKYMLFFPKGKIDRGESPKDAAERELQEETNFKALEITSIGKLENDKIKSDTYVFVAKNLVQGSLEGDELEESEVVRYKLSKLPQLITSGQITEARTIASLFLLQQQ